MAPKVWLITGAGSGFGKETTKQALESGDSVLATDINVAGLAELQSAYPADKLLVQKLDVTSAQDITDAFAAAKKTFGHLDVVFSNAGHGVASELEGLTPEHARGLFDVDFWGATNVGLAAVKFFREENAPGVGGRLLFTSSMLGQMVFPIVGIYNSAKHALEGYAETLAAELDPSWNIKITILEPGIYRTGAVSNTKVLPVHPAYDKPHLATTAIRQMITNPNIGGDPKKLVKQVLKLVELEKPPLRIVLGKDAIGAIEAHYNAQLQNIKEFASWSEDLEHDA
ncbi:hypothetical protein EUX98_g4236 [Antrodiella citrinella]|uniref:NAD(P)-binding protein n=1 Tax=Antrodiella citrinella TaxID=2447956 RepID=A0A4S4N2G7_9APHY|nr:hypothetical protein EUX98_g4236 [Antrodiella citrinella]